MKQTAIACDECDTTMQTDNRLKLTVIRVIDGQMAQRRQLDLCEQCAQKLKALR